MYSIQYSLQKITIWAYNFSIELNQAIEHGEVINT